MQESAERIGVSGASLRTERLEYCDRNSTESGRSSIQEGVGSELPGEFEEILRRSQKSNAPKD